MKTGYVKLLQVTLHVQGFRLASSDETYSQASTKRNIGAKNFRLKFRVEAPKNSD